MKVLILGLPYFSKKIAQALQTKFPEHQFKFLDTSNSLKDKLCFLFEIITANTVYQIGGTTQPGGALRWALFLNKKIIFHWVGTDTLNAIKAINENSHNKDLLKHSKHLCEVSWIQKELATVNISAKICHLATIQASNHPAEPNQNKLIALTYIGKDKEKFYGLDKIISAAKIFPQIEFRVAGIEKTSFELPQNIHMLGWIKNLESEFKECSIYLRLVEHDGLAFTVLEALSHGRHVLYSQNFDCTIHSKSTEDLIENLKQIQNRKNNRESMVNFKGFDFIKTEYNKDKVLNDLIKELI